MKILEKKFTQKEIFFDELNILNIFSFKMIYIDKKNFEFFYDEKNFLITFAKKIYC